MVFHGIIEATFPPPQRMDRDPRDANLVRVWRRIPELRGRPLRVVFRPAGTDIVVVTLTFDRGRTDGCRHDIRPGRMMIRFSTDPGVAVEGEEVHPDVILHFDAADRIIGVEILHARKALAEGALAEMK